MLYHESETSVVASFELINLSYICLHKPLYEDLMWPSVALALTSRSGKCVCLPIFAHRIPCGKIQVSF